MAALTSIRNTLASVWTWLVLTVCMLLFMPFILIWRIIGWPFDRMNYIGGRLFRIAGALTARLTPRWHFSTRGSFPANPRHPYVVVANHESFSDIVLICLLPWEMKWLGKRELMWIPVVGWLMWAARDVPVKRGRATSAKLAMAECAKRLAGHVSVLIFPEGTRTRTGELLPFKDGAFRLAVDTGVPILPLAISGTRNAVAPKDWRINPATAIVEVLEPVPSIGMDPQELKAIVRARIEEARDRLREELAAGR